MRTLLTASVSAAMILGVAAGGVATPEVARAQIGVALSVGFAPPPLPIYAQPPIPGYGYIWTPGYWSWDPGVADYYWVPGAWVLPPRVGLLWTPGYWGWNDGVFVFNDGYWGPTVGFYGGIDYGFGYFGYGYGGGYWNGDRFFYNREVNNVSNITMSTVYDHRVASRETVNTTSFNGGRGGINAAPTARDRAARAAAHVGPTAAQAHQRELARSTPALRASVNHGRPSIAATSRAGEFKGRGVVPASRAAFSKRPAAAARAGAATLSGARGGAYTGAGAVRPAHAATSRHVTAVRHGVSVSHNAYRISHVRHAAHATYAHSRSSVGGARGGYRGGYARSYRSAPAFHPSYRASAPTMRPAMHAPAARASGGRPSGADRRNPR